MKPFNTPISVDAAKETRIAKTGLIPMFTIIYAQRILTNEMIVPVEGDDHGICISGQC